MAEQTISQSDLANLAKKLDEIADVLTEKERAVMLAVFKLAGQAIAARLQGGEGSQKESGGLRTSLKSASLSEGFRGAFKPIGAADFNLRDNLGDVASGVGIGVVW